MESHHTFIKLQLLITIITLHSPFCFIQSPVDINTPLHLLQPTSTASMDFGRIVYNHPHAVQRPQSPTDISLLLTTISSSSPTATTSTTGLTVAARGNGHSVHGQAQALDGIVVEMGSLRTPIEIHSHRDGGGCGGFSYADVGGGALWVELLEESLKEGLTPRSWTDYLYLTVGGTLSNGGISGQTFKYGPQISNVLQLDVVTGTGELVTCSPNRREDLFFAVLGGLGQFGIITGARIILEEAPQKVRWVRAFYDDFETFADDQELMVAMPELVDYVEGFMVLNEQSVRSSSMAFPSHLDSTPLLRRNKVHYCLEFAVYVYHEQEAHVDHVLAEIEGKLSYMPSYMYKAVVSYYDFLNRVKLEEMSLRSRGLWDVPHPWLNLFVPKSGIINFKDFLLDNISTGDFVGHILIYPILKDKWHANTSAVLPESSDKVLYVVGILRSAHPGFCSPQCLIDPLEWNRYVARTAGSMPIGAKQYLAHQTGSKEWRQHFGSKWGQFSSHKSRFDPHHLLSPGQNIFRRKQTDGSTTTSRYQCEPHDAQ